MPILNLKRTVVIIMKTIVRVISKSLNGKQVLLAKIVQWFLIQLKTKNGRKMRLVVAGWHQIS